MVNRQNPRRRLRRRLLENKRAKDVISSLPDEILLHILSFIPTKLAIRTSLLSKRWRYIWCDTPSLYFDNYSQKARVALIDKSLNRYTAPKMKHFRLRTNLKDNNYIKRWIKLAMSRNVENVSLQVTVSGFKIPDEFFCQAIDISSLTEAKLDICINSSARSFKDDFPQAIVLVLDMLVKLQHVEKLTFGGNFLKTLSLAEVLGDPFPMLGVKTLILETGSISKYVVPGIERLLQNLPELKKLTIRARDRHI
ncbi:PREDICTED: putative F-box/LRR-repeat protein At3g18150 [Camelina sativa]|uniref:F-box/LRR-repeat protein At3g18150 n=1 Tax=Camelina sativa TaxID=90675 RepID=A0ABM0T0K1_CAMSA|nr:PREDICTED: putative F-box/LRR-repeat protein At3g18150 [Camelina sativa]